MRMLAVFPAAGSRRSCEAMHFPESPTHSCRLSNVITWGSDGRNSAGGREGRLVARKKDYHKSGDCGSPHIASLVPGSILASIPAGSDIYRQAGARGAELERGHGFQAGGGAGGLPQPSAGSTAAASLACAHCRVVPSPAMMPTLLHTPFTKACTAFCE